MTLEDMAPTHDKPFRFFDLPAELRDAIYDFLPCQDRILRPPTRAYAYSLTHLTQPIAKFMLVNKRFRDEYTARTTARESGVRIKDERRGIRGPFKLPPEADSARKVIFELTCNVDDHFEDYLDAHVRMIEDVVKQMKTLRSIHIEINFDLWLIESGQRRQKLLEQYKGPLERLTSLKCLELLLVYLDGRDIGASYREEEGWTEYVISKYWE